MQFSSVGPRGWSGGLLLGDALRRGGRRRVGPGGRSMRLQSWALPGTGSIAPPGGCNRRGDHDKDKKTVFSTSHKSYHMGQPSLQSMHIFMPFLPSGPNRYPVRVR